MTGYDKPLPEIGEDNRPFWQGARDGKLRMQRCDACMHLRYPISQWCPRCLGEETTWVDLSGRGVVASTIVFHQVYSAAFAGDVPYNVSMIQLDEGPRMFSNVVGVDPSSVRVGAAVEVSFDPVTETVTVPRFTLVDPGSPAGRDAHAGDDES